MQEMQVSKSAQGLEFEPDMPKEALDVLRSFGARRSFRAQQIVANLGDDYPDLFVVEEGRFSISVIDEYGNSWIYGYLGPGSTWGLKAVLTRAPAGFVFEALEDSTVICVDRKTLWSLIDENSIVRRGVISSLGWSITKATEFAHKERSLPLRVRLRYFLVEKSDAEGVIKLTQRDMSRILGV